MAPAACQSANLSGDNAVVATITGLSGPVWVAVSPDSSRLYVTNKTNNTVSVIDTATNTVITGIATGGANPWAVAVSPDGAWVYITDSGGAVSVISVVPIAG